MADTVFRMGETSADLSPHWHAPLSRPAASLSSAMGALIGPSPTGVGSIKVAVAPNRLLRRAVERLIVDFRRDLTRVFH